MSPAKALIVASSVGAVALALGACSSGSSGSTTVTVTATPSAAPSSAAAKPSVEPSATAASVSLPAAPAGASVLQTSNNNGVQYARYSTSEQPAQVVSYYSGQWQNEGYAITNTGGGGGGWGKYGGSDAGATGSKSGSFVAVQAGGSTQGPTYFEVCQGANQQAVDECGNSSKSGSS